MIFPKIFFVNRAPGAGQDKDRRSTAVPRNQSVTPYRQ